MHTMDDAQQAALVALKEAAAVFCNAIRTFDKAVPECQHGGSGWIEHIYDVIHDIEADIEDDSDVPDDDE